MRAINTAPQDFKRPNYENFQIDLLKKKGILLKMFSYQLVKMINAQRREEAKTEVARAIYAFGIRFDVVRSSYW